MGVAGFVVIERDPIECRAKVDFDPAHKVAGVRRQVGQVSAVFRRDDEPELVAIVLAAIKEGLRLGAVLGRRIELPTLAIARRAVALDVAQMGGGFTVLSGLLELAGFHDYSAHPPPLWLPPARKGAGSEGERR